MTRAILAGLVLTLSVTSARDVAAQRGSQKPLRVDPMTASIKGVVTVAETGAPIRDAEVRLSNRGNYSRLVTTDGEGRFSLTDLAPGEYRLTVSRTGFTSLVFGQRRPLEAPTAIDLSEGETFTANLALTRGGAIHGRVLDQFGDPIAGTRVQVLRSRMVQGRRRLQSMGPGDQTDDTGFFRVYGVPPGDYYVTASTGPADSVRRDRRSTFPERQASRRLRSSTSRLERRHQPISSYSHFVMLEYPGSSSIRRERRSQPWCSCRLRRWVWARDSSTLATHVRSC